MGVLQFDPACAATCEAGAPRDWRSMLRQLGLQIPCSYLQTGTQRSTQSSRVCTGCNAVSAHAQQLGGTHLSGPRLGGGGACKDKKTCQQLLLHGIRRVWATPHRPACTCCCRRQLLLGSIPVMLHHPSTGSRTTAAVCVTVLLGSR